MPDKKAPCAHPDNCPQDDSFAERVKTQKLALDPPPPTDVDILRFGSIGIVPTRQEESITDSDY